MRAASSRPASVKLDAPRLSLEQRRARVAFERLDAAGDRGRAETEPVRGRPKAAEFGRGEKRFDGRQRRRSLHQALRQDGGPAVGIRMHNSHIEGPESTRPHGLRQLSSGLRQ